MASQYDRLRATAKRLIDKFGRPVSIRRSTGVLQDPARPWLGNTAATVDTAVRAVFATRKDVEPFVRLATGRETPVRSAYESEQGVALVAAIDVPFEVEIKHRIVDAVAGKEHEIGAVEVVSPGDLPVIYILTLVR